MNTEICCPWTGYMKPFKIFGNLYYVGSQFVCTHLIDTGDGLILIDPGYPQLLYMIINNICELGFKIKDIKYIVCTHGHYDHLGAVKALKQLAPDAKVLLGKEDREFANGTLDLTWAKELGAEYYEAFEPDILIENGDKLTLGNTEIVFKEAAGHTPGTKALFFDVSDGKKTLRAGMHGGVGIGSMKKEFLDKYGLSAETREKFIPCIDKIFDEKVEIHLGNHIGNNDTLGKYNKMTEEYNPFIDDGTNWKNFLNLRKQMYYDMINSEN